MDIKHCTNNYLYSNPFSPQYRVNPRFCGLPVREIECVKKSADIFVKGPVATTSATGLLSLKPQSLIQGLKNHFAAYKKNIKHTYEHKVVFAIVEKELYGTNSIDSFTHDLDKLIMYSLGLPRSFVSKIHKKYSTHHAENNKTKNIKSMAIDNIASSPIFKPEKKLSLRDYYASSKILQNINGFGAMLEKVNYGENLNYDKINQKKNLLLNSPSMIIKSALKNAAALALIGLGFV